MSHTLAVTSPALPDALEPVRLSGHEGLNALFEYELALKPPDALSFSQVADIDLDALIGCEISYAIELDDTGEFTAGVVGGNAGGLGADARQINALIAGAQLWGEEGRHIQDKLTLRPWLHLAPVSTDWATAAMAGGQLARLAIDAAGIAGMTDVACHPARQVLTPWSRAQAACARIACMQCIKKSTRAKRLRESQHG
ncbi:contractile injection system protein, VgrG/Pvc8 family [Variovorax boronicumulans]|uniref:contractile injection system protein, VgrG/Pvc8 family n=1 Tax=Variovorax boronicumulans TaxID=436515 RepID=UPI0012FE2F31|nr:contractile injection system protein, VgrG/Pvc8 family [Variovorax boronicumulans]